MSETQKPETTTDADASGRLAAAGSTARLAALVDELETEAEDYHQKWMRGANPRHGAFSDAFFEAAERIKQAAGIAP